MRHRFISCLAVCLGGALVSGIAGGAEKVIPIPDGRPVAITVVDEATGEGIPGTVVRIRVGNRIQYDDETDEAGRLTFNIPKQDFDMATIRVAPEHYVPKMVTWHVDAGGEPPDAYTVKMTKGTVIGGTVTDEVGHPIYSATVYMSVPAQDGKETVSIQDYYVTTDEKGHWTSDIMPADLSEIRLMFAHMDYVSDESYEDRAPFPIGELRDQTSVAVLRQGIVVRGSVLDPDGNPIRGARIELGDPDHTYGGSETTAGDGKFQFVNCAPGPSVLTVRATGCAPELMEFTVKQDLDDLVVTLGPGHRLAGNVVDEAGSPIADAMISATTWRGYHTLGIRIASDEEGRFEFDSAPAESVEYMIVARNMAPIEGFVMKAGEEEYVITMAPPREEPMPAPQPTGLFAGDMSLSKVKVGDVAPAFEVKTLDGKSLKLEDYRGKYVLLDFWATWCGPCRGETPTMKAVYEKFGTRDDFAMIGLSLDEGTNEPTTYAKENELAWAQGFLGPWGESDVPEKYGVEGIPCIMLLDPEGKVVAKDLRGDGIAKAIETAMK